MSGSSFTHHRLHALGVQNRRLLLRIQSANIQKQDSALELHVLGENLVSLGSSSSGGFLELFLLLWLTILIDLAPDFNSPQPLFFPSLNCSVISHLLHSPAIILTVLKILSWVTFWYFPVISQAYSPEVWVPEFLDLSDSLKISLVPWCFILRFRNWNSEHLCLLDYPPAIRCFW